MLEYLRVEIIKLYFHGENSQQREYRSFGKKLVEFRTIKVLIAGR